MHAVVGMIVWIALSAVLLAGMAVFAGLPVPMPMP
jgi:hypothetical protein